MKLLDIPYSKGERGSEIRQDLRKKEGSRTFLARLTSYDSRGQLSRGAAPHLCGYVTLGAGRQEKAVSTA